MVLVLLPDLFLQGFPGQDCPRNGVKGSEGDPTAVSSLLLSFPPTTTLSLLPGAWEGRDLHFIFFSLTGLHLPGRLLSLDHLV